MANRIFPPILRNALYSSCSKNWTVPFRNYWQRRGVFSELSSTMQSMEKYMRDMDREMSRIFSEFQRSSPMKLPSLFSPSDYKSKEVPVVFVDGSNRSYRLELDMHGMEPEDINVTLKDQELTITAKKQEESPDGSKFSKESSFQYTLPKDVNVDAIRSSLTGGVLIIEVPLPSLESKEIPVKKEPSTNDSPKE